MRGDTVRTLIPFLPGRLEMAPRPTLECESAGGRRGSDTDGPCSWESMEGRRPRRLTWRGVSALIVALAVNVLIAIVLVALGRFGDLPAAWPRPAVRPPVEVAWISPEPEEPEKMPAARIALPEKPEVKAKVPPPRPRPRADVAPAPRLSLGVTLDLPGLPSIRVDPAAAVDVLDLDAVTAPSSRLAVQPEKVPERTGPLNEHGVDIPPRKKFAPRPVFPRLALRRNIMKGSVQARLLVAANGRVTRVEILKAEPNGYFENTVRAAARDWVFHPARLQGRNVDCWCRQEFCFRIENR